jgi:murein DD-endopeptidase MepM/ murein hydrolase activator NlpD
VKGFKNQFKYIKRLFILICALCITGTSTVSALSKEQLNALDSGALWVNTEASTNCTSDVNAGLRGGGNAEKIFNYFIDHGLKPPQAAGIMGNLSQESGLNPKALEPGTTGNAPIPGRGYGLAQWTPASRQQGLINQAKKDGGKVYDLIVQLNFMYFEATKDPTYGHSWEVMKAQNSVQASTLAWHREYEKSADGPAAIQQRVNDAVGFLSKFGSNDSSASSSADDQSCASDTNGEVSGDFSLPVAKKFYTQHPDWFSKPHHDYPAADIPVPSNTRVFSITAGKVLVAPVGGSCGNGIMIDAGQGNQFLYCHGTDGGSVANAKLGDTVEPGQLIMHSDNTGHSTGAHLHVQIRVDGQNRCPQTLFKGIAEGNIPSLQSLPSSGCTN